jgi:hypothetical protein
MAINRWWVKMIKGSDPEEFMIVGQDLGPQRGEPFMTMGPRMSEEKMRKELETQGASKVEIDGVIKKARENPMPI